MHVHSEKFRVVKTFAFTMPPDIRHVYRGNDLRKALDAFIEALGDYLLKGISLVEDNHRVTGEHMVEARRSDGRMVAALYGISPEQWRDNKPNKTTH